MTQHPELFAALAAPFESHELKVRAGQSGRHVYYITARTAMNRLDSVLGPENWWDEYVPAESSVLCRLTIRLPDGSTVTKSDAGGYAGLSDSGDDDKSGFSDAFKRAAAKFGVARYLYRDGVPTFVREREPSFRTSDLGPEPPRDRPRQPRPARPAAPQPASRDSDRPRTGKALFAWTKEHDQNSKVGLLKYLNNWAKGQKFPTRMIEWDPKQVNQAYAEALRKLESAEPSDADGYADVLSN
jgi:hypothetical protein